MNAKIRKKVLLLEPNYRNKFPPIALMKLATYHRNRGNCDVMFYKGDLKLFVIERVTDKCLTNLIQCDSSIDWQAKKDIIFEYIKTKKSSVLYDLPFSSEDQEKQILSILNKYKNYYWRGVWKTEPEWDRVCVTTLFTFYWDITIETINFAKHLVRDPKNLLVGGVLASIQPQQLYEATGIYPHVGVLNQKGVLDDGDEQIIDELPLDYSILDEIDYKYPMSNAYYGYMSRGCIRHCPFCAVPTLEPQYIPYIELTNRIEGIRNRYGEQKNLLLMDNNVLASEKFEDIITELRNCGFARDAKFTTPNQLEIAIRNLEDGWNDRAYIRKTQVIIKELYDSISDDYEKYEIYKIIEKYHVKKLITSKKENLILAAREVKPYYDRHNRPHTVKRYIDFNQGVDARLFDERKAQLLSSIAIRPLRVAFDNIETRPAYEQAIRWSAAAGIKDFSNYLLYNFNDQPIELYQRIKINVDLCDELGVNIYSFPMKYHPLRGENSHDRDYIGKHWNRKYIRAIQAILNSTKGKIGKGKEFFGEAFGHSEEEYLELLEMPETFIIYRFFFKWLDTENRRGTNYWRKLWNECHCTLSRDQWDTVIDIIHRNIFNNDIIQKFDNPLVKELLLCYVNYRKDIVTKGTELYTLKQAYDRNPIMGLRR